MGEWNSVDYLITISEFVLSHVTMSVVYRYFM